MKVLENGKYRDMTAEELQNMETIQKEVEEYNAFVEQVKAEERNS